ncbi:MAG: hypothetical protein ACE5F9_06595 [Phycisphaerae bacterium]
MSDRKHQKSVERKRRLRNRRRRIHDPLRDRVWAPQDRPVFTASNIQYELADRIRGLGPGGIGAIHMVAERTGLRDAIDEHLHVGKVTQPG